MPSGRAILHVDMDAFFASVEQLDNPELRGRPVLVGGSGPRGVVTAASYEARPFGCHSAQPTAVALRRCPDAVVVRPRGERYREMSQAVFAILEQTTPLVQPLSIDEAFLDVTGSTALLGAPEGIARSIKDRIRAETGLTASVGVAGCKFMAKLASDLDKPDGLTMITDSDIFNRVAALPVSRLWGVGPATERRLLERGFRTFRDFQSIGLQTAQARLGSIGIHLWRLARGDDPREVSPDHHARSIGCERTFGTDLQQPDHVRQMLLGQTEYAAYRLRRHDLFGRTVTVKIRFGDFQTVTRSETLRRSTDRTDQLWNAAAALFDEWANNSFRPVRLIGISISQLEASTGRQLELFADADDARRRRLDQVSDAIFERYGRGSIQRGVSYTEGS